MNIEIVYVVVTPENSITDATQVFADRDDAEAYLETCDDTSFIEEQPILDGREAKALIGDRV